MNNLNEVDADDYPDTRQEMVERLVDVELDAPHGSLMSLLEDLVMEMYTKMDDDSLQSHYDTTFGKGEEE